MYHGMLDQKKLYGFPVVPHGKGSAEMLLPLIPLSLVCVHHDVFLRGGYPTGDTRNAVSLCNPTAERVRIRAVERPSDNHFPH
jgi:hypothetical protein